MESSYPEPWSRYTPKGMSIISSIIKSKKCCDSCDCETTPDFNKLMETQLSFEE
jgi:hypothetical protein